MFLLIYAEMLEQRMRMDTSEEQRYVYEKEMTKSTLLGRAFVPSADGSKTIRPGVL